MNVRSILEQKGSDVATVGVDDTVAQASAQLRDRGVGALVVTPDGARIVGIVSERDIVRAVASHGASALGRSVGSVMTSEVVTCGTADTVEHLMTLMTERRIRHVPVADADGRLGGIVSIGDVVNARVRELHLENQALTEYIHQGR
ncbi:MAG: CBS domain-containing protein [Acidimicrobiales bacterium]|nr:CBS domain-containing protein [Acidimicrobiales bacterium]MCB9395974.1 CBS domain-containing protein [Acidimicrobiaceae bacterium]